MAIAQIEASFLDDSSLSVFDHGSRHVGLGYDARIASALHAYLGPNSRAAILPQAEGVIADRMLHQPTPGLRIVNLRTFTAIGETPWLSTD